MQWRKEESSEQILRLLLSTYAPSSTLLFILSLSHILTLSLSHSLSRSPTHSLIDSLYRAYARIGNVYVKQDKLDAAIKAYDHSLAEHRNQDVVKKREEVCTILRISDFYHSLCSLSTHTHTHTYTTLSLQNRLRRSLRRRRD